MTNDGNRLTLRQMTTRQKTARKKRREFRLGHLKKLTPHELRKLKENT